MRGHRQSISERDAKYFQRRNSHDPLQGRRLLDATPLPVVAEDNLGGLRPIRAMLQMMMMVLQIYRSDTRSIDAVIDRFATTAVRRLNFLT